MNKKLFIGLGIIIIGIAIALIVVFYPSKEGSKTIELSYKSNGGVPYKWEYTIEDTSIVQIEKTYVLEDTNVDGRVGGPIITNYVFKGLKEGTTTVTFKYVSIVDGSVDKEEVNTLKVDKNKNISLDLRINK